MKLPETAALLFILFLAAGCSSPGLTILSYNTEALFDDIRDGTEFPEYNPDKGKWDSKLFKQKLQAISRVIREAVPGGADVVALQEIENLNTLNQLKNGYLKSFNYAYAVLVPAARSAINVAVLSRHRIDNVKVHNQPPFDGSPLRNILEAAITYQGRQLVLFSCHWKSRIEGAQATEAARLASAYLVKKRITALLQENPALDILVAGDFNENPDEYTLAGKSYQTALIPAGAAVPAAYAEQSLLLANTTAGCSTGALYDPWFARPGEGSYYYNRQWQQYDHILLTCTLFDGQGFSFRSFGVIKKDYMLNKKTGAPLGWDNKLGGFSDHLPVVVSLTLAGE